MTSVLPSDKAVVLIVEDEPFVRMMVFDLFADGAFFVGKPFTHVDVMQRVQQLMGTSAAP